MNAVESINIIEDAEGELRVSSLIIAGRTENQHKNVLELLDRYMGELLEFGEVAFETRPGYNNASVRYALLNEQQATLLLSLMRNTAIVVAFKVALVKEFYRMRQLLAAQPAAH